MKDMGSLRYAHLSPEVMEVGLQVAGVGIGTVDYGADTVQLDQMTADLFRMPAAMPVPRAEFHARIHPEDWPDVERHVERLLNPAMDDVIDLTHRVLRPDGTVAWLRTRKKVRFESRAPGARPLDGIFAVVDVTAERQAELQSRFLIGELAHRSKNLIAVVSGIARQLQRHSTPETFVEKLQDRLAALARNQDAAARAPDATTLLSVIVESQLAPFTDVRDRVTLDGPPVPVGADAAQTLAMVMHELLTNAVKYGALSADGGTATLVWRMDGDGMLDMTWTERGGPPVTPPTGSGFGTQVLTRLVSGGLDAETTLDYAPEGLTARFRIPEARLAPVRAG